jgi:hypothetical protein
MQGVLGVLNRADGNTEKAVSMEPFGIGAGWQQIDRYLRFLGFSSVLEP